MPVSDYLKYLNATDPQRMTAALEIWRSISSAPTHRLALEGANTLLRQVFGCDEVVIRLSAEPRASAVQTGGKRLPRAWNAALLGTPPPTAVVLTPPARSAPGVGVLVPLTAEQPLGNTLLIWRSDVSANDLPLKWLTTFGRYMAEALLRLNSKAALDAAHAQLAALSTLLETLNATRDLDVMLRAVVKQARSALDMEAAAIYLRRDDSHQLSLAAEEGLPNPEHARQCGLTLDACTAALFAAGRACINLDDLRACASPPDWTRDPRLKAWLSVPVDAHGKNLGMIFVASWSRRSAQPSDVPLLTAIGQQVAVAVARAQTNVHQAAALAERNAHWSALYDVAVLLTQSLDSEHLLDVIVRRAADMVGAQRALLVAEMQDTGTFSVVATYDSKNRLIPLLNRPIRPGEGVTGVVLTTGQPLILDRYHTWPGHLPDVAPFIEGAVAAVPLRINGRVMGVLGVTADDSARQFNEDDVQALTLLAQQAAAVIERARARVQAEELAVRAEQTRLARDLHDGLAQDLATLLLRVDLCLDELEPNQERMHSQLDGISGGLQHAIRDARAVILGLRVPDLVDSNLHEALNLLAASSRVEGGAEIRLIGSPGPTLQLTHELKVTLLRFAQETLSNAVRHSGAHHITMQLANCPPDHVSLTVTDDGQGFDVPAVSAQALAAGRLGLLGMRERAAALGGQIILRSTPEHGTHIQMTLPCRGEC